MKHSFVRYATSIIVLISLTFGALGVTPAYAATFTPGNLVVNRVGDGSTTLGSGAFPVALVEYNTAGVAQGNVISLPSFASGGNNQGGLTDSGSAGSNGQLNLSADGQYLTLMGYDAQVGTASVNSIAGINRNIANINANGNVTIKAKLTDAYSANNPRGAVSANGSDIWTAGNGSASDGGVRYVNATTGTPTTSTLIGDSSLSIRNTTIFGGVLFSSTTTSMSSYGAPSTPPTSATVGTTLTFTTGGIASGSGAFVFFDRDSSTGATNLNGLDTLYLVDGSAIEKYEWTGSGWTQRGSATYSSALFGLTAVVNSSNVDLYATTGLASNNALLKVTDSTGFGGTITLVAANFSTLANAGVKYAFRGVAFAPVNPATPTPTITPTSTVTNTSTATLTPSETPIDTLTPSETPTDTLTPTITSTTTLTPTSTTTSGSNTAPSITGLADGASGALGDSTTPIFSGASGFPFSVSDAQDAPSALSVSIVNSNPALVTATLVTVNATLGQYRLDFSAPLSASGIATITVTVTDSGSLTGIDTFQYGSSDHDATRPNARYHTGSADASTVFALDANYMVVGDDEDQVLRVYDRNNSGAPVAETDMTTALNLTDISGGIPREVDIEGSTFNGTTLYIIGSHDNHSGGNARPNRSRLFGVTVSGSGANTTFTSTGYYQYLKADLIAWDNSNGHGLGAGYLGLGASAAAGMIPEQVNGFNIEGLSFAPGSTTTVYIGFRAPLEPTNSRTKGLIVPVTNVPALMNAGSGSAVFGTPILLDLGGRGIRDIECNSTGCYIMAGDVAGGGNFALFRWTGNAGDAPVLTDTDLTDGGNYDPGLAPEGIIIPADINAAGATMQTVSDNGDTIWYANGVIAKDLTIGALQKFRSDYITTGSDVLITPTPTITPTPSHTPTVTPTSNTPSTLIISEVSPWSSGVAAIGSDWFEVTNIGASAVNITGWKMDDNSNSFASAVALNGITSIAPGESVIFLENNVTSAFNSVWFNGNPPAGLQFGTYTGSGVGLGTSGDTVNLYDGSGTLQASVSFGTNSASPFKTFDNAQGLNNTTISQLSVVGINGAFVAANDANEAGSPGTIANPSATATPTATTTSTNTTIPTNTATNTAIPTETGTFTPIPSKTATPTPSKTVTWTPTLTDIATGTSTPTPTFTASSTNTVTNTPTQTVGASPTHTATYPATRTKTATSTPTRTSTKTPTKTRTPITIALTSIAAQDGWVLESAENSNVGNLLNSSGLVFSLGDDAARKQYRGILSFNTSIIPDNATITGVMLKVKKFGVVGGGDPLTIFQGFMADVKNGVFGITTLQASDFQTLPSSTYGPFLPVLVSNIYSINLTAGKNDINILTTRNGLTQIRLRFKLDDNNDARANFISLYSSDATNAADRPQLVITYTIP